MASTGRFDNPLLDRYEAEHDIANEAKAQQLRGEFLEKYPPGALKHLTLEDYVVGHQTPSFCNFVESRTRAWANIQGATARKFGVYFGRTKQDPHYEYRVSQQFGTEIKEGFVAVKQTLLELVRLGSKEAPDFAAIDANALSQMFKAKILSLYYPERFAAICSYEALEEIAGKLGFAEGLHHSEIQNKLSVLKTANATTRSWSYPKYMRFLFDTYIRKVRKTETIRKPRKKVHRKVNFEDVQTERAAIGKKAEAFALRFEKDRLIGDNLGHLVERIADRRDMPSYGYDFLSHTSATQARYIEVKSVSRPRGQHRFYLSDNEHTVSHSKDHRDAYYFYLVSFDSSGEPVGLRVERALDLYPNADISPASYSVFFEIEE